MCSMIECYGPLLCNLYGPGTGYFKHEEDAAGPKMATRLQAILGDESIAPEPEPPSDPT